MTTNPIESPVQIVESSSIPGAGGGVNSAMKLADSQHGESVTKPARNGDMVTQQTPSNGRFYLPSGYTRICNHCGREYTAKRDTSRFCTQRCRVNNHRAAREAGGGRVGAFLALAGLVIVIWYLWPLLGDVAAARPRLPDPAPAAIPTAVIWPTMAPAQNDPAPAPALIPTMAPAPTAVPVITLPTAEPLPTAVPATAEPLPTIAPTAVPATSTPAAVNQGQEGQGGQTYTLTTGEIVPIATAEFYATCAYNQAAGRRVRPDCPANAAALLGAGR
jgi:hypothetical protein